MTLTYALFYMNTYLFTNISPKIKILNDEWYLHPTNITHIVNIFSISVLGATLPNPTDVKDENVKYRAVI